MDAIDKAIEKGYHNTNNPIFCKQTWKDFEQIAKQRKVFLFGLGNGAEFYYFKYGERASAEGIIDNNLNIQGKYAQEFLFEKIDRKHFDMRVSDISLIKNSRPEEIAILISSLKYYEEIATQIANLGITDYFSVLCMEAHYREENGIIDMPDRKALWNSTVETLPIENRKICIVSMFDYAGHGKEIVRQLLKIRPNLEILWIGKNINVRTPNRVKIINQEVYRERIEALTTAKVWLIDGGKMGVKKRKEQFAIQMKHWASVTLKQFANDELRYRKGTRAQLNDHSYLDYIFVGSKFDEMTCRSGFDFSGETIEVGSPRSDVLFRDNDCLSKIQMCYPQILGKRLLLYAPTFRLGESKEYDQSMTYCIDADYEMLLRKFNQRFGQEWMILLRLHPNVASASKDIPHPDYVIDVSDYYDSEELVAASDAMITDYSSIMFEPAFVHKPVFLLATDRERYLKEERGFLIDYNTLPFPRAASNAELARNIESFDEEKYVRDVDAFLDKYGVHEDGHAGERAARFILDLIDGKRG